MVMTPTATATATAAARTALLRREDRRGYRRHFCTLHGRREVILLLRLLPQPSSCPSYYVFYILLRASGRTKSRRLERSGNDEDTYVLTRVQSLASVQV